MPGGLKAASCEGGWSNATLRNRYYMQLKSTTDPFLQDYFFKRFVKDYFADPNMYGMYFLCAVAGGICFATCARHLLFNPDVYFRRQENVKPMPDRHRQFAYAGPYLNHQLRNWVSNFRWMLIDNEPDYSDWNPAGIRPDRTPSHKRYPSIYSCGFGTPKYYGDDDMLTTCSHSNYRKVYKDLGYQN